MEGVTQPAADGSFDGDMIERIGECVRPMVGDHGFIVVLVRSAEQPDLRCATNLLPEHAIGGLLSAAAYLNRLHEDAKELIAANPPEQLAPPVDAPRLGDGEHP